MQSLCERRSRPTRSPRVTHDTLPRPISKVCVCDQFQFCISRINLSAIYIVFPMNTFLRTTESERACVRACQRARLEATAGARTHLVASVVGTARNEMPSPQPTRVGSTRTHFDLFVQYALTLSSSRLRAKLFTSRIRAGKHAHTHTNLSWPLCACARVWCSIGSI